MLRLLWLSAILACVSAQFWRRDFDDDDDDNQRNWGIRRNRWYNDDNDRFFRRRNRFSRFDDDSDDDDNRNIFSNRFRQPQRSFGFQSPRQQVQNFWSQPRRSQFQTQSRGFNNPIRQRGFQNSFFQPQQNFFGGFGQAAMLYNAFDGFDFDFGL